MEFLKCGPCQIGGKGNIRKRSKRDIDEFAFARNSRNLALSCLESDPWREWRRHAQQAHYDRFLGKRCTWSIALRSSITVRTVRLKEEAFHPKLCISRHLGILYLVWSCLDWVTPRNWGAQAKHVPEVFLSEAVNALNGWSQVRWKSVRLKIRRFFCDLTDSFTCLTWVRRGAYGIWASGTSPCPRWKKSSGGLERFDRLRIVVIPISDWTFAGCLKIP